MRNAGKSSLVNAVTGQKLAVVSDVKGTTTDPVQKAMELLPLGPVVIIDTPGIDDDGYLGEMRVSKTKEILRQIDIAILVVDGVKGLRREDEQLIGFFVEKKLPYIVVYNKSDLFAEPRVLAKHEIAVSAEKNENIFELKEKIGLFAKQLKNNKQIVADLLQSHDVVVLVTPIDSSAPKGRLILPQQQVLRELLDFHCIPVVCQSEELSTVLSSLAVKPKLIIIDSQATENVINIISDDVMFTSFSILFARYKGNLETLLQGAKKLDYLNNGDCILISESCTHHRQCNDIGTVKLPEWIRKYSKKDLKFEFTSGTEFPEDLSIYSLVIHCGGCMSNDKEMSYRVSSAHCQGVPMVNYGIAIMKLNNVLDRSLGLFVVK